MARSSSFSASILGLGFTMMVGFALACSSSASDPKSACLDGCAKGAKACSQFDRASCESTCNSATTSGTPSGVPAACKSQASAYQSCASSASVTCPDGRTPQISGCDKESSALFDCVQANSGGGGGTGGTGGTGGDPGGGTGGDFGD